MTKGRTLLVLTILLGGAAGCGAPEAPSPSTQTAFTCHALVIGLARETCVEDISGPGTLTVEFKPDPPGAIWDLQVSGLADLADECEFAGPYEQTRLSTLQGRGETSIRCMLSADVQRTAHEIAFKGSPDNVAGSIAVTVTLTR
jgi:hypothetical protein